MYSRFRDKNGQYLGKMDEEGRYTDLFGKYLGRRNKRGRLYDKYDLFLAHIGKRRGSAFKYFKMVRSDGDVVEERCKSFEDFEKKEELHQTRVEIGRKYGGQGRAARWGANHGKTVTVRTFESAAKLLREKVPERDRASFVAEAILAKLAGEGQKEPSASVG